MVDAGCERVPAVPSPSCTGPQHHTEAERVEGRLVFSSEGVQVPWPELAELAELAEIAELAQLAELAELAKLAAASSPLWFLTHSASKIQEISK